MGIAAIILRKRPSDKQHGQSTNVVSYFHLEMPPLTRSSAPSTPAKPRVSTDGLPTPGSSTRRTPHCTKCHRPRAGHPRSGCPYVDTSESTPPSPSGIRKPISRAAQPNFTVVDDVMSEGLSSLHIVSPTTEAENRRVSDVPHNGKMSQRRLSVRFALVPEQTLASLSPTDAQLVEQLLQPGMVSDDVSPRDKVAHVLKWRKTLADADPKSDSRGREEEAAADQPTHAVVKEEPQEYIMPMQVQPTPGLSRRMPGTLSTPSLTVTEPVSLADSYIGGSGRNMNDTVYQLPDPGPDSDARKAKPLYRSLSFEQRSLFLQQLSRSSATAPATLVSIPVPDLDSVQSEAESLGFRVRVLPSRQDDHKWVVLGTEEEAIDLLATKFLEEEKRSKKVEGKPEGGKLRAVAGGVVFGAVATWTGLAFS